MLSVRFSSTQESQLEYLAAKQGLSKNQIVIAAVEQFLKMQEMGYLPVEGAIREAAYDTFMYHRARQAEEWPKAARVAEWARDGCIWSARPGHSLDGSVTGALYGRNVVVGYIWKEDTPVHVLSKYLGPHANFGVAAYGYEAMEYEQWERTMMEFPLAR